MDVRNIVLNMLIETLEEGRLGSQVLSETLSDNSVKSREHSLTSRDRSFIMRLYMGVLEKKLRLDFVIDMFSKIAVSKMKPVIRNILRMAVYQIIFMDSVPDRATVSEAVRLTGKRGLAGLSGFVNGVCRRISDEFSSSESAERLKMPANISAGLPKWLYTKLCNDLGTDAAQFFKFINIAHEGVYVRLNSRGFDNIKEITENLAAEGCRVEEPFKDAEKTMPTALRISGFGSLTELKAFKRGEIFVQDISSQIVAMTSGGNFNSKILDVCAAPGGKSIDLALDYPEAEIIACDISETRAAMIRENIARLNISNVEVRICDAEVFYPDFEEAFDIVLADLPCSGLGTITHKPDIKYRLSQKDIESLSALQRRILSNVCRYVKPGGTLVYSVCTLTREECEDVSDFISKELPKPVFESESSTFKPVPLEGLIPDAVLREDQRRSLSSGRLKLIPGKNPGDGFFIACFVKS